MQIVFNNTQIGEPEKFIRRCGYGQHKTRNGEVSYVKRVHGDWYPRFHVYILVEKDKPASPAGKVIFNLHLDQRATVYAGVKAHAGEYDGEVVEREAQRIKNFIK